MMRIKTFILLLLFPLFAHAQLSGHNTKGDFGMLSGTQATPGFYVVPIYYAYSADTLRDRNGDKFAPLGGGGSIDASASIVGGVWVTEKTILGGYLGFSIFPGVTNNALELPALQTNTKTSTGLADLYFQPITLGWNKERADFIAGIGIVAPTGKYDADGDNNRGLGMWSYELFGGSTVYFDEAKNWHLSAFAAYEMHGKKDGTDVRVGDIITIEGGFGRSFMGGAANAGIAYYAQWKVTDDDFGLGFNPPGGALLDRHRVFGIGPEVTIPIASKSQLYGFLNLRYFWETGARSTSEGNTLILTVSLPVPSIPFQ